MSAEGRVSRPPPRQSGGGFLVELPRYVCLEIPFGRNMLHRMKSDLKQIEDQARALSAEERAKLAESMLESLHEPLSEVEQAWADEVERRVAAFDRGEMPSYPAEDVFAEARRLSR